jgi:hypothetical protein
LHGFTIKSVLARACFQVTANYRSANVRHNNKNKDLLLVSVRETTFGCPDTAQVWGGVVAWRIGAAMARAPPLLDQFELM